MKHIILILLFSIFVSGCLNRSENMKTPQLFIMESLNDTLNEFINYVEYIENPYNNPEVYWIYLSENNNDTIIEFCVSTIPIEFVGNDGILLQPHKKGGYINNKSVIVFSELDNPDSVIGKNLSFNTEFASEIDSILNSNMIDDYIWDFIPPYWSYKLSNNSIRKKKWINC